MQKEMEYWVALKMKGLDIDFQPYIICWENCTVTWEIIEKWYGHYIVALQKSNPHVNAFKNLE